VVDKKTILAYAEDIVILGNARHDVIQKIPKLLVASENIELCINEIKT